MKNRRTNRKQPCTYKPGCTETSIPGLAKGNGHCAYHWAERIWGTTWAETLDKKLVVTKGEKS